MIMTRRIRTAASPAEIAAALNDLPDKGTDKLLAAIERVPDPRDLTHDEKLSIVVFMERKAHTALFSFIELMFHQRLAHAQHARYAEAVDRLRAGTVEPKTTTTKVNRESLGQSGTGHSTGTPPDTSKAAPGGRAQSTDRASEHQPPLAIVGNGRTAEAMCPNCEGFVNWEPAQQPEPENNGPARASGFYCSCGWSCPDPARDEDEDAARGSERGGGR